MNGYFYVLTSIDIFVLGFMCVLTKLSESLNQKQKRGFLFAFGLIAFISLLEVVTLKVDGLPIKYRWLNIISNYLGFGLTPSVCICLVYVLDKKTKLKWELKIAILCEIIYLLILGFSIPFGWVFSVSQSNIYSRGPYFFIYIFAYFLSILYLSLSKTVSKSKQGIGLSASDFLRRRNNHTNNRSRSSCELDVCDVTFSFIFYIL